MIAAKPKELNSVDRRLRFADTTVRRDGWLIAGSELESATAVTAAALEPFRGCRVALLAQNADQILIALAAAEVSQCQVILCRTPELAEGLLEQWRISAIIEASLSLRPAKSLHSGVGEFAVLIMSSGTTGVPKLAQHSLDSLLGRIRRPRPGQPPQKWLLTYHPSTYGGLQVLLSSVVTGSELITTSNPTVINLCEAALAFQPSHISGTPTFWRSFLLTLGPRARSVGVEQITLGGEIADAHILKALRDTYPAASISHIYASTEAGALFSVRDGLPGFPATWLETGVEGIHLRICEGVLQVKSSRGMERYVAGSTSPVITDDGWLNTGDLVEPSGGRVYFRGRQDTILNVGGAKVRPEEVEQFLLDLPEIADAKVYGMRNPITGIVLAADIVPNSNQDIEDLKKIVPASLRARLEQYKVPRILNFVSSIAVSEAGKKKTLG
ncbi:MAG: class I adenylate-forming enzyme family protein [Candidatus Korobacteraceae bacterium]